MPKKGSVQRKMRTEREAKVKIKHSIRFRLTCMLTILLTVTIFTCWFINKVFLGDFYEHTKINNLGSVYEEVNRVYQEETSDKDNNEEVDLAIERMTSKQNISLYIFNIYLMDNGRGLLLSVKYPGVFNEQQYNLLSSRIKEYYTGIPERGKEAKELLLEKQNYSVYKLFDNRMDSYYIELFGTLDSGNSVYIRTNFESIQESVGIANLFLTYVGIITVLIGTLLMYGLSKSFTKPILEVAEIAKEMSDLNFDIKYETTNRQDEIGELGNSINILSEKLESTISELKTANNELKSDIEKKIQIDEMRKDFLSNVSHELKTPIALIQGYAEGLKENINEDEESREFYCDVIVDEAVKMNEMVKKLLSLNQLEFGNTQVNFERFDITALLQSVLNATDILFQQKNVILRYNQPEPIYVWADEYRIEEVVTNYISNALNHVSGENIIEVKATVWRDTVRVSVFNTGDRIPEEELENIWVKFYKVDKARTREYGGSGIGLSIVKAIMNSLNRECGVKNWENGVEFWFELDGQNIDKEATVIS